MVCIHHKFLLGQEVQCRRSSGEWHNGIITAVHVEEPEKFWEPPTENDYITITFVDRSYKQILLQQELQEHVRVNPDEADLLERRKFELFRRAAEEALEADSDFDATQGNGESPKPAKRKTEEASIERQVQPRLQTTAANDVRLSQQQEGVPKCMNDDNDDDDELLELACKLYTGEAAKDPKPDALTTSSSTPAAKSGIWT